MRRLLKKIFGIVQTIVYFFRAKYNSRKHRKQWRILNQHNETTAKNLFPISQVKVGRYTYGDINVL